MIIAECKHNLYLTKTHSPEGTKDYDDAANFKLHHERPTSFGALCHTLNSLEDEPHKCVLRGNCDEIYEGFTNRRKLAENEGTIKAVPRQWALFDFDGVGGEWTDWAEKALDDPEAMVVRFLDTKCPPELRDASVYWQYGSSIGVNKNKFSLHLWVWLSRPVYDMKPYYKLHGFDPALAGAVQVHYTARPIFKGGMIDPMGRRSGVIVRGGDMDATPILEAQSVTEEKTGGSVLTLGSKDHERLIDDYNALDPSEGERHDVMMNWSLQAVANSMSPEKVEEMTRQKLLDTGYSEGKAKKDAHNMVKGALSMVGRGRVELDKSNDPTEVFTEHVENTKVEDVAENVKAICGPSFMDRVTECDDPLSMVKENWEELGKLSEVQMMDLEEALEDAGALVENRPGKGQITRSRLGKMRKEASEGGKLVLSEEVVGEYQERWFNTYVSDDQKTYFLHNKADKTLRALSKRDELDTMCSYLSMGMPRHEQLIFRERFYKSIHEDRMIAEWVTKTKPFGESEISFEQRGDGKLNAVVCSSVIKHLEVLRNRAESVEVPVEFERWLDKNYNVVWDIMKAVLARRFLGDKRSTIWVHCSSNWGKTFFFDVKDFGLTMNNQYSSEDFKGNDPSKMSEYLYLFVDEADRFTKEMKLDSLPYRRLWGGHTVVTLPARILASANPIRDLEDGVDQQLLNRVVKVRVEGENLEKAIEGMEWTTDKARGWYEALLVRRLHGWLMDWGSSSDFTEAAGGVYRAFTGGNTMGDVEDIETMVHRDFWDHFMWDHIYKMGKEFKLKGMRDGSRTAWAADEYLYVDNGSEEDEDRRRLYMKRPHSWLKIYATRTFGDKCHAVLKAMPSVDAVAKILGGKKCQKLPNQERFQGIYFDISSISGLEEAFKATKEG